jgi:plasmid replication initiation protein
MAKQELSPIVKKSNALCRASWSPESIWEARLVALVASKIKITDEDFKTYELLITDIIPERDRGGTNYNLIDKATDYSMTRVIKIKNDKTGGWDKYNLFAKCSYNPQNGSITVSFHPDLKIHYLNLQKQFAKYELTQFLLLPSTYSQRLYEILKSWDDKSEVEIDLTDLHKMLNVPNSIEKNFGEFRRRVLEKSHTDIHKHTSLKYEWEPIKKGRAVIAIKFVFAKKRAEKITLEKEREERKQRQKNNNKLGIAAVKCFEGRGKNCSEDNQKTKNVCEVCKKIFPR